MMEITTEIREIIDKAAADLTLARDEYIDPADGLLHCKNCGGYRQAIVANPFGIGYIMPRCICPCQAEAEYPLNTSQKKSFIL